MNRMTRERLIVTLTDCVRYFVGKYELGYLHNFLHDDDGIIRHNAKNENEDSVSFEHNEDYMEFKLSLNHGLKEVSIMILPEYDVFKIDTSDFKDFNYLYNKIKEAMK